MINTQPDNKKVSKWLVGLLCLSTAFLFADQNLTAPNLSAISKDFGFSDAEKDMKLGGEIPFSFFVVGGSVSIFIGPLADKVNRRDLFAFVVLMGNIPCLLTYWVTTYRQFFWLRTLTGVSIGGATPVLYSLFSDIFPPSQRALASAGVGACMGIGTAVGQVVAGFIGPTYGWRVPFLLVSVPSICLAGLIRIFVVDPRHSKNRPVAKLLPGESTRLLPSLDNIKAIFRVRTNQLVFAQAVPGCLPWGVIGTYLNDYFHEQGLSVEGATTVMLVFGIGCLVGMGLGGTMGQRLYNQSKSNLGLLMGATTFLGVFPLLYLISRTWPEEDADWTALVITFFGGISALTGPNVRACLMNVNGPEIRGTVFSIFTIMDDLGKGLGPGIVAYMISYMGRSKAFFYGMLAWVPCSIFLILISFSLAADEELIRVRLKKVTGRV